MKIGPLTSMKLQQTLLALHAELKDMRTMLEKHLFDDPEDNEEERLDSDYEEYVEETDEEKPAKRKRRGKN